MVLAAVLFMAFLFVIGVWCVLLVSGAFKRKVEAEESDRFARPRQPELTPQQALIRARAEARREAAQQRADRWKNLTPALVNQAFRNFYEDETGASFDASLVSDAFEKFTKEMRAKQ